MTSHSEKLWVAPALVWDPLSENFTWCFSSACCVMHLQLRNPASFKGEEVKMDLGSYLLSGEAKNFRVPGDFLEVGMVPQVGMVCAASLTTG